MTRMRTASDFASRHLFVFSLCLISLVYGVIAGQYELFPHDQLRDAMGAAEALLEVVSEESEEVNHASPVVRNHAGIDDGALILVSGGKDYLKAYNPNGGCIAWLMDRSGTIQHVWKFNPEFWADLEHVSTVPFSSHVRPIGVHLLEDGSLIVSFQGENTFPFAIGLARLDKDSNIVWKKECFAHHWFDVTPDGKIITPTLKVIEAPQRIGRTRGQINGENGKIFEDMITVMSLDGEILEEISMLDAMHDSGLIGLYQGALDISTDAETKDPLHLNSVQCVGEHAASANDWLNADDLLVSFRSINSIAILDRSTARVKWLTTGTTLRQHSPKIKDRHSIVAFDNLGGDASLGGTRLVEIGLNSRRAETIYPTSLKQARVFSDTAGHLDLNRDGSAVLMAVTAQARVLEIDLNQRKVLWEYVHPGRIYTAKYYYNVSFDMNQTGRAE